MRGPAAALTTGEWRGAILPPATKPATMVPIVRPAGVNEDVARNRDMDRGRVFAAARLDCGRDRFLQLGSRRIARRRPV